MRLTTKPDAPSLLAVAGNLLQAPRRGAVTPVHVPRGPHPASEIDCTRLQRARRRAS